MDNITNKATGLTKEMLDMTYGDKYYKDVINPAKLGQGPIPSKTQMMYQNLKSGGPFKAMFIGAQPGKYGERAMPTGPAKAALGGFGTAARTAFSLPMTAGALAQQGLYSLNKPSTPAGFNYAQNLDRNSISSIADETAGLDYQQDYMRGVMNADKNYTGVTSATQNQTPYNYDDVDKFTNDEQGPIVDQEMQEYYNTLPEEEKEGFGKFLSNAGVNIGNFAKDAAGRTIASQVLGKAGGMMFGVPGALAGMMFGGFKGGNMFGPSQSSRAYDSLNSQGRSTVDNIYGSGGIMSGYNPVSAFGRGPIGAIDNRMGNISNRTAPQTAASQQRLTDLYNARSDIMQTTLDDDAKNTGPTSSARGQKAGVMDDDPFATGPSKTSDGDAGGSTKIVCTMMNDSYGFGNFRNKIWLKHSKDLPKEYEIGYHKIFLPLVKFAKGQGKINKVVKKTLEHIARHRTLDLKQEMKGKTHLLGRIYRKILEPICFIAGMYR